MISPSTTRASSSAPGTRVVLPAPGGATSTQTRRSRTAATISVSTASIGRGERTQHPTSCPMLTAMLFPAPAMPDFEPGQSVTNERFLRYDDCIQDGRLTTLAIPPALSTLWQSSIAGHPGARAAYASGALSLLTRLTVTSLDAPI